MNYPEELTEEQFAALVEAIGKEVKEALEEFAAKQNAPTSTLEH